jgi:GTP-binding protein EngB required for normal cell division
MEENKTEEQSIESTAHRVLMIGQMGAGKSSTCQSLCNESELFKSSAKGEACT